MSDSEFPVEIANGINSFLDQDRAPRGQLIYPEVYANPFTFPLQRVREAERMLGIAESVSPRIVMEIGSDKAGSLYHWCQLPSVERVIACEVRGTPYAESMKRRFPFLDFLFLPESSYATATVKKVAGWLRGDVIDILFIDGDKGAFDKDFASYLTLMNPQGIVFMHDVGEDPMRGVFEKIGRSWVTEVIEDRSEGHEAVARMRQGVPASCNYENWLRYWRGRSCTVGVVYLSQPKGG